jgi:phenylacetate-CoA ligase
MTGKYVGEKEVKLWGSERDLFEGTVGIKNKAINFIYNRRMLNCLRMSSRDMEKYVRAIIDWRPKIIWAYANAIFELSNYIERNSLKVYAPNSIICCATTLYPYMREKVERVFNTKVYNQYGGREVGDIACECEYYKMHIFNHTHFIEIVDGNDELIEEGIGNIIVTSLTNYSMPFLRYKVGDMGEIANDACNCNRAFNHFQKFIGRDIETFYKQDGEIVLGEFFALLLFKDFIKKFQIVQEKYDHIGVKLILDRKRTDLKSKLNEIQNAIKQVMGQDCEVEFQVVDELDSKLPSGKNIYVISKVRK